MKLYHTIYLAAFAGLALVMTGCNDDDDDWKPGPASECVNQVYFTVTSVQGGEIDPGDTTSFEVTASRESASGAISVPLTVTGCDYFSTPSILDFADGEAQLTFTVAFTGTTEVGDYACVLQIPEGQYSSPYTSRATAISLKLSVMKWNVISDEVKISSYSYPDYIPEYTVQLLQADGQDLYRLKGFMSNYDLTFEAVYGDPYYPSTISKTYVYNLETGSYDTDPNSYYLFPTGGSSGFDPFGWGGDYADCMVWGFDEESLDNSYTLYIPSTSAYYLEDVVLMVGYFYSSTYINFEEQEGRIYAGYSVMETATDEDIADVYDYIMINW
ncbi:MAG: hypothetical protein LIO90_05350 [Bacteroidales bacterium]|nr:hypothetical protein [Bacteroidales bacterium]